jgi:hypothetical protein
MLQVSFYSWSFFLTTTGQKIAMLVNEEKKAGGYTLILNIKNTDSISIPAGIYFCRITEAGQG